MGAMFEQILVDEYQDLNALQVEIVRELRRKQQGLTAVGDDAQAIYGFRAASAEHILNFREHYPDATIVTLERNYRSTQPILDLANEIAAGASRAYPKRLRADREGDNPAAACLLPRRSPTVDRGLRPGAGPATSKASRSKSRRC